MLIDLKEVELLVADPNALKMAIWFHDTIYDTKSKTNEEDSFKLANILLSGSGVAQDFINKVKQPIMATKHTAPVQDNDSQIIMDLDILNFGKNKDEFLSIGQDVRDEYDWVSDKDFKEGRKKVLNSFLTRPSVFSHKYFKDKYESTARDNLREAIKSLD
jgi:predicted metal-dependent HD superfamily phosphohydrolase